MSFFSDGGAFMWVLLVAAMIALPWAGWYGWRGSWRDWGDVAIAWLAFLTETSVLASLMGLIIGFSLVAKAAPAVKEETLLRVVTISSYPMVFAAIIAAAFVSTLVGLQLARRPEPAPRSGVTRGLLIVGGLAMAFGIFLAVGSVVGIQASFLAVVQNQTPGNTETLSLNLYRATSVLIISAPVAVFYLVSRPVLLAVLNRISPP